MYLKKIILLSLAGIAFNTNLINNVYAGTISVKCETRGTSRSKISIDGGGLTGTFYARVTSGGVTKQSKTAKTANAYHQVEFDFDSNASDIAAGATAIPANYIKKNSVIGYIRRSGTNAIVGAIGATCRIK